MKTKSLQFVYFGGEPLGRPVLETLHASGLTPSLIVCSPDRPVGRKQVLTPPPVKVWAKEHDVPVFQPASLKEQADLVQLTERDWDLFVVVAYNHILPKWLIEHPEHGAINLHPSLLPKLRGPSPIRSAILRDEPESVGTTVILLDEEMDHGPIIAREPYPIPAENWPVDGRELGRELAAAGGELLARTIPEWVAGKLPALEQDHESATYTKRLARADGELDIDPHDLPQGYAAREALLQIRALAGYPETFFIHNGKRIKIKVADLGSDGSLRLLRVVPEGRQEMVFEGYLASLR